MAPPLPASPRLITFDTYGTLIDWDAALRRYVSELLERKGAEVDRAAFFRTWYYEYAYPAVFEPFRPYRQLLHETLQAALHDHGLTPDPHDGRDAGEAMAAAEPFPDAVAVLERLNEMTALATISNSQHDIISDSVAKLGDPFTYVLTGEDTRAYKPAAALFELVLERAGVNVADTVHVAQSQYVDLPRSIPMGIPTVWINRQGQRLNDDVPAPTAELPDLRGLFDLLAVGEQASRPATR